MRKSIDFSFARPRRHLYTLPSFKYKHFGFRFTPAVKCRKTFKPRISLTGLGGNRENFLNPHLFVLAITAVVFNYIPAVCKQVNTTGATHLSSSAQEGSKWERERERGTHLLFAIHCYRFRAVWPDPPSLTLVRIKWPLIRLITHTVSPFLIQLSPLRKFASKNGSLLVNSTISILLLFWPENCLYVLTFSFPPLSHTHHRNLPILWSSILAVNFLAVVRKPKPNQAEIVYLTETFPLLWLDSASVLYSASYLFSTKICYISKCSCFCCCFSFRIPNKRCNSLGCR